MRRFRLLAVANVLVLSLSSAACSPPAATTTGAQSPAAVSVSEPTSPPTPSKDLPESACAEPMYDPNMVEGPKTEVRIEVHDATGEQLALTELCILVDGRSVFSKAQMHQAIAGGGKGTVAWTGPVATASKHTVKIMMALSGAGSAEISKLRLKLRGERTFNAKAGLVVKIETVLEGDAKAPLDTRAALHVSPMDP